ncbi:MAG: hypothetical protein HRT35_09765 [Algicola sp.]|nr:hypothetical protein [Algicola sp.]
MTALSIGFFGDLVGFSLVLVNSVCQWDKFVDDPYWRKSPVLRWFLVGI